jgi:hypothetical protein
MKISKSQWVTAWRTHLSTSLDAAMGGQVAATAGTRVDGDHRPENRGERAAVTTQGYLAHGLAQRVQSLEAALHQLDEMGAGPRDQIVMGAIVALEGDAGGLCCGFFPGGDGTELTIGEETLRVLSFRAPLGRALKMCQADDVVEVHIAGQDESYEILSVR